FDVLVVPKDKRGWITHRAVQATHGDLGEPDVARIACHALQPHQAGEVHAAIHARLAALDMHPAEPGLVEPRTPEDVGVTRREVSSLGVEAASKTWDERLLQHARAVWLRLVSIK